MNSSDSRNILFCFFLLPASFVLIVLYKYVVSVSYSIDLHIGRLREGLSYDLNLRSISMQTLQLLFQKLSLVCIDMIDDKLYAYNVIISLSLLYLTQIDLS